MTNQYYEIKVFEKVYYCKITFKKITPKFSCKIYLENVVDKYIALIREITTGDSPINITNFIISQIQNIYNIEKDKITIEEINYKLFNSTINKYK